MFGSTHQHQRRTESFTGGLNEAAMHDVVSQFIASAHQPSSDRRAVRLSNRTAEHDLDAEQFAQPRVREQTVSPRVRFGRPNGQRVANQNFLQRRFDRLSPFRFRWSRRLIGDGRETTHCSELRRQPDRNEPTMRVLRHIIDQSLTRRQLRLARLQSSHEINHRCRREQFIFDMLHDSQPALQPNRTGGRLQQRDVVRRLRRIVEKRSRQDTALCHRFNGDGDQNKRRLVVRPVRSLGVRLERHHDRVTLRSRLLGDLRQNLLERAFGTRQMMREPLAAISSDPTERKELGRTPSHLSNPIQPTLRRPSTQRELKLGQRARCTNGPRGDSVNTFKVRSHSEKTESSS